MARPFILKNVIHSWPASNWTPDLIANALSEKSIRIRLGPKHHAGKILWETDSIFIEASLKQMLAWYRQEIDGNVDISPFSKLNPKDYWAYVDYKYMFDLFDDDRYLKAVDWSVFECGLDGRDGVDSTIWLGTLGAYTPCHYDTYGFNLVVQIFGRKRWILFPPTDDLSPTRLPYEESSVFSSLDFIHPNAKDLRHSNPHVVTLEPGDVLFVPPKWWHFVQSISDITISINTWIDTPVQDDQAKRTEALTRVIMAMTSSASKGDIGNYVISDSTTNANILSNLDLDRSLEMLNLVITKPGDPEDKEVMDQFVKRWQPVGLRIDPLKDIDRFCRYLLENSVLNIVTEGETYSSLNDKKINQSDILKTLTHPDCVNVIYNCLMRLKNLS